MKEIDVYFHPATFAAENGELDLYRKSFKANVACKEAIEDAIRRHYSNNYLDPKCVSEVADRFGFVRVLFVLANTVVLKDWDARFSRENKTWAASYDLVPDVNNFGKNDRRVFYIVDKAHPVLVDQFINNAREQFRLAMHSYR